MDPLTLIVTALIAGAAAGGQDAASSLVRDAYTALRRRVIGDEADEQSLAAIDANDSAAGSNRAAVEAAVTRANVVQDTEVQMLAQRVHELTTATRAYDLRHAQGVHAGDGGRMEITIINNNPASD